MILHAATLNMQAPDKYSLSANFFLRNIYFATSKIYLHHIGFANFSERSKNVAGEIYRAFRRLT